MDFWNTVLGNRLAETLCATLPQMAKERKQEVITVNWHTADGIREGINSGKFRFVGTFSDGTRTYVVIEK